LATTELSQLNFQPLAGSLGAEVHGINLRAPLSEEQVATLRRALLEYLVLFFPGQHLSAREQRDFAAVWGEVWSYPEKADLADPAIPEIAKLSTSAGDTADIWHTDGTHRDGAEIIGVLSAVSLPPVGGDTMWSSQYRAYEDLSAPMRNLIDGLTAVHDDRRFNGKATTWVERPVVRVHPETGRRCLYVNQLWTNRITQMSAAESQALLAFLFAHSVEPRFVVRYRWTEGTVVVWDQRCTQHYVVNDFKGERVLYRTGIPGDKVVAASEKIWDEFRSDRLTVGNVQELSDERKFERSVAP
jgi:taurine dioxygenase